MAKDGITLGRFQLVGIPPSPRGVPKIEVIFDIDSNGIVTVSAKDQATGQEQSIKITSQTSLSDEEIQAKIDEAAAYEAEDKAIKEKIQVRNEAENIVYSSRKTIEELGDKLSDSEKESLEVKIKEIEEAIKTEDTDRIKASTEAFQQEFSQYASKIYGQEGAEGGQPGAESFHPDFDPTGQSGSSTDASSEEFIDADYEVSDSDDSDK